MKYFAKYLLIVLIGFLSCSDEEQARPDTEYFPLEVGLYQIYSIEENIYTELDPPVRREYELKTEIVDSFVNQEGGTTFVIHRSTRDAENDPWEFQEAWSTRASAYQAIVTEGNISFIRIAFPATKSKEWNGNALNSLPEDSYEFTGVGDSFSIDEQEFDDCLVIVQEQSLDFISKDEREEVYARNVGLVYKVTSDIEFCNDGKTPAEGGCVGLYIIKSGFEIVQVLKEYGKN